MINTYFLDKQLPTYVDSKSIAMQKESMLI